ncbi:helix-turn-helix transcriptional regulator [Haloarchaeobius sp. TZWSO28]|uniref:helix-turn-helix transcriptional regulator n=1 Tax=unclassified Haloarchaeobius TaxID=2614452 RepID=UPI003EBA0F04
MAGFRSENTLSLVAKRRRFLSSLADEPKQKPALAEDCGVARSTVDRAIRELETAALVERGDCGYELTVSGELVFDEFQSCQRSLDAITETRDVLDMLPRSDLINPEVLVGADVTRADMHAPDRAIQETVDLVSDAVQVRGVSPAAHAAYVEVFDERIHESGMNVQLVFTPDVFTELATTYAEYMSHGFPDYVSFYEIPELPPLGVLLVEHADGTEEASFGVYTPNGVQAVVRNTRDEAICWAENRFEEFREQATEFQF